MRVLDGLEGAANTAGGKFDRQLMEQTLAGLGARVFLMNNVHEDAPVVFHVRWILSYLSGPLARNQIKALMDPIRPAKNEDAAAEDDGFAPPGASSSATDRNTVRPKLPEDVTELFQPTDGDGEHLTYTPAILRSATVLFDDAKRKISGKSVVTLVNAIDIEKQKVLWDKFIDIPKDDDLSKFESEPVEGAAFADLPGPALKSSTYTSIKKDFTDWVYANHSLEVFFSPLLEAYSNPGEKVDEFKARITLTTREKRDAAIEELRERTTKAVKALEAKASKAMTKVETQKAQASSATMSSLVTVGGGILGAIFGRKSGITAASSSIAGASRVMKERREAAAAASELEAIQSEMADLEKQLADDTQKIRDQYDPAVLALETVKLTPVKKNIQVTATGILWLTKS
jgi:Skp family chaperone for outer membrane proteins